MSEQDYDWEFEPMSDDELDSYVEHANGTRLEGLAQRMKALYQRLRAEVAEDQVPDTFKDFIKDDLELDE